MKGNITLNLPPASVLVMDNVPYDGKHINKPTSSPALERDMTDWLGCCGEVCDNSICTQ